MAGEDYQVPQDVAVFTSDIISRVRIFRWPNGRVMVLVVFLHQSVTCYLYTPELTTLLDSASYQGPVDIDVESIGHHPVAAFTDTFGMLLWYQDAGDLRAGYPHIVGVDISGDTITFGNDVQLDDRSGRSGYRAGAVSAVSETKGGVFWYLSSQPFDRPPQSRVVTNNGGTLSVSARFEWGTAFAEDMHHRAAFFTSDGRIVLGVHHETASGGTWRTTLRVFDDSTGDWDDIDSETFESITGGTTGLVMHTNDFARILPKVYVAGWMNANNANLDRYLFSRAAIYEDGSLTLGPAYDDSPSNPAEYWDFQDGTNDQMQGMLGWPDSGDAAFGYRDQNDTSKLVVRELRFYDGTKVFTLGDEFTLGLSGTAAIEEFHFAQLDEETGYVAYRHGNQARAARITRRWLGEVPWLRMQKRASSSRVSTRGRHDPSVQDSIRNPGHGVFI